MKLENSEGQTQMEGKVLWDLWPVLSASRGQSRRLFKAELISGAEQCECTDGAIGI